MYYYHNDPNDRLNMQTPPALYTIHLIWIGFFGFGSQKGKLLFGTEQLCLLVEYRVNERVNESATSNDIVKDQKTR